MTEIKMKVISADDSRYSMDALLAVLAYYGARVKPCGGGKYKGYSPFQKEKHPSFVVFPPNPPKYYFPSWHDFSTGKRGCSIEFILEMEYYGSRDAKAYAFAYEKIEKIYPSCSTGECQPFQPTEVKLSQNIVENNHLAVSCDEILTLAKESTTQYDYLFLKTWQQKAFCDENIETVAKLLKLFGVRMTKDGRAVFITLAKDDGTPEVCQIYDPKGEKWKKYRNSDLIGIYSIFGQDVLFGKFGSDEKIRKEHLILTKSPKDCMVLHSLGFNSLGIMSESFKINDMDVSELVKFSSMSILYDNDETGRREASNRAEELNGIKKDFAIAVHFHNDGKGKDASDRIQRIGREELRKEINALIAMEKERVAEESSIPF